MAATRRKKAVLSERLPAKTLDGVFRPKSVAVVGASRSPLSIGHEVVANLVNSGFTGPVYPVNPKAQVVRSMRCYPSLAQIPEPVDLAVIVVPATHVAGVAKECATKGVKGLVVVSAGFREIGGEGIERERQLVEIARSAGMRIIGPNCMGVVNTDPEVCLNASFAAATPMAGSVAFVSQSGALGEAILADAREVGLGIRMFASVGNRADVGAHDLCEYWEHDPGVELILLYLESFGDPQRFKEVAERLRGKKPILAVKSGRSAAGARAAGSHTGSMAGEDVTVDTFLRQCGVLRAQSLREMFQLARALLHQPHARGEGIAVVTNAGGPGILATDALAGCGLDLARFSDATQKKLRQVLPPEASPTNPVDLIASADADRYRKALRCVIADRSVHALLVLFVSPIMIDAVAVARAILDVAGRGKPVVACVMGRQRGDEATQLLHDAGLPVFRFPEEAAHTLYGLMQYRRLAEAPSGKRRLFEVSKQRVAKILKAHEKAGGGWLASSDARAVLAAYGMPVVPTRIAATPEETVGAARALGYPVCVKAAARDLVHKSDHGGVQTNLTSADAVYDAAAAIERRLGRKFAGLHFEVQKMAPGHRELLLGLKRDVRFGPILAVGIGGITVEVLRDVSVRAGPLTDHDARQMLSELRGAPLLGKFRGEPAIDTDLIEECLLRLDQLARDFPRISEADLNPVIAAPPGTPTYVVDARIATR